MAKLRLLAEIEKYDAALAARIKGSRTPSTTRTDLLVTCIEELLHRFLHLTNAQDHYNPLMRRFISPAFCWTSNDSGTIEIGTTTYEEFADRLKALWTDGTATEDVQLEYVDLCTHVENDGTSRARAFTWMTVRVNGSRRNDFLNGVMRDMVGRAKWERSAETGWVWTGLETMRGLQIDGYGGLPFI
jgi:hypothetical protein